MGMSSRRAWDNSTGKLTAAQKDCLRARLWESDLTGATVMLWEETGLAWQAQLAQGGCPAPDDDWRINCLTVVGPCPRVLALGLLPSPPLAVRRRGGAPRLLTLHFICRPARPAFNVDPEHRSRRRLQPVLSVFGLELGGGASGLSARLQRSSSAIEPDPP